MASFNMNNFDLSSAPTTEYFNRGKNKGDPELQLTLMRKNRTLYTRNNLNERQRELFDYVIDNPHDIVLLQAGPGTNELIYVNVWKF